ncbi:CamS family sex pheromone protein [Vagococcus elongatus]|uniref:CamS family sex pheromone protein n=1 Tax=Vagococcus elongatus TaxID=180344 RepID=A0A430ARA8_9ENTE|nr:CamS family sex pheromone protein [Vagococcus elongatus]RSU10527.1 hypothetical protein CBF29_09550 [Vagococcus elongatus]
MKKAKWFIFLASTLMLSACGNLENSGGQMTPEKTGTGEAVTTGQINSDSYQALMIEGQYKTSPARTMAASRMNSNYNLNNYDKGLLELSKEQFATDKYFFEEGQFLTVNLLKEWLARESSENKEGLNPSDGGKPVILQQIIEQNFMDKDSQKLAGISIGVALNSVDYSGDAAVEISDEEIIDSGKKIVEKILPRLRALEGVGDVPIIFGLFNQSREDDVAGGNYFASVVSKKGDKLADWQAVDEEYIVLPVDEGVNNSAAEDGVNVKYKDFKQNIQGFFPNLSGFSGKAYYRNQQMQKITIIIEAKYYHTSELQSFTQFVGNSVRSIFNVPGAVEVQINHLGVTSAVVMKPAGEAEVIAQVFN